MSGPEGNEKKANRARRAKWAWRFSIIPWTLFWAACVYLDWDTMIRLWNQDQVELAAAIALLVISDVSLWTQGGTDAAVEEEAATG